MLRRFDVSFAVFSMLLDASFVCLALGLSEFWRPGLSFLPWSRVVAPDGPLPFALHVVASVSWVVVLAACSLYNPRAVFRAVDEFRILLVGSAFAALTTSGLLYLTYRGVSRWLFAIFVLDAILFLFAWRVGARVMRRKLGGPALVQRRVVVVGTGEIGRRVGRLIGEHYWFGLELVGYLGNAEECEACRPILGEIEDVRSVVLWTHVDEVVVALPYADARLERVVKHLLDVPLHVRVIPSIFTLALDRAAVEDFGGLPMVDLRAGPLSEFEQVAKRCLDLLVSGLGLVFALPAMGAVALAISLDSEGPVLFKQQRVGENGKLFTMYKFRSMVRDAERLQAQVIDHDANGNVVHKRKDDPRVTRVGRLIRNTSLDELPQLFNILRGDMSLVGPRPELPWLVEQYEPWQRRRLVVPQGLTGWWQVNGRSEKLMHLHTDEDIHYIANYSIWLDFQILWKTLWAVLQGRGAL